ncbi:AAC(3) family N-acetyltransferase [Neobacillus niacini]|uniref:AAC(3) family N-acetyltransferase n=1 Tax=Neobacillus niacini TaxID=86668 RepID=UPI003EBD0C65
MGLNSHFTPYTCKSSWGKILDQKVGILLIGVNLRRCTYMQGVEEWFDIPGRMTCNHQTLYTILPDKRIKSAWHLQETMIKKINVSLYCRNFLPLKYVMIGIYVRNMWIIHINGGN